MTSNPIVVVSRYTPESITFNEEDGEPILDEPAQRNDKLDDCNHPRYRRAMILKEFAKHPNVSFETPSQPSANLNAYENVHSPRLVDFLSTAWDPWEALGEEGQDPMCNLPLTGEKEEINQHVTLPLIPGNIPLSRNPYQRPSKNVMGQVGFFCTDTFTPIFAQLQDELLWDCAVVQQAVDSLKNESPSIVYALATHPGHHAAHDSFGGYCYLNHAAFASRLLQKDHSKVAILDVDYVSDPTPRCTLTMMAACVIRSTFSLPATMHSYFSIVAMAQPPSFMRIRLS
jgi:acetoin utilization deacetylase AcuC-like enzyme